jgi:hypothetical protein
MDTLGINVLASVVVLMVIMVVVVALVAYLEVTTPQPQSRPSVSGLRAGSGPRADQAGGPDPQEVLVDGEPDGVEPYWVVRNGQPATPMRRKSDPRPAVPAAETVSAWLERRGSPEPDPPVSPELEPNYRAGSMPGPWHTGAPAVVWPDPLNVYLVEATLLSSEQVQSS